MLSRILGLLSGIIDALACNQVKRIIGSKTRAATIGHALQQSPGRNVSKNRGVRTHNGWLHNKFITCTTERDSRLGTTKPKKKNRMTYSSSRRSCRCDIITRYRLIRDANDNMCTERVCIHCCVRRGPCSTVVS